MKLPQLIFSVCLVLPVASAGPSHAQKKSGSDTPAASQPAKKPASKPAGKTPQKQSAKPAEKPAAKPKPADTFSRFEDAALKRLSETDTKLAGKLRARLPRFKTKKAKIAYLRRQMGRTAKEYYRTVRLLKDNKSLKSDKKTMERLHDDAMERLVLLSEIRIFYKDGSLPLWYDLELRTYDSPDLRKKTETRPAGKPASRPVKPSKPKTPPKTNKSVSDNRSPGEDLPTEIIAVSALPDLTGCGLSPSPELAQLGVEIPGVEGAWETGAVPTPCPAFTGGFVPDLDAYCRAYQGGAVARWLPDGRPICHSPDYVPSAAEATGYWMLVQTVCNVMSPHRDDIRAARTDDDGKLVLSGHLYPVVKLQNQTLECFYLDIGDSPELTLSGETATPARKTDDTPPVQ